MSESFDQDVAAIGNIKTVPTILDIVCRVTGMGFAAVARVTESRWIACSVMDRIEFGLRPGDELDVTTTICHEIRESGHAVIIDNVDEDPLYREHPTPRLYGLQSYISIPIRRVDGSLFGTLCAVDPAPRRLNTPETIDMFQMFAQLIGEQLSAMDMVRTSQAHLVDERKEAALREEFIAVLGHDLRNPLAAIDGGMRLLLKTPLNERATSVVGLVQDSVRRMAGLIDNVMDFARGRLGGGLTLDNAETGPIEPTLQQVVAELQATVPERLIETHYALDVPFRCDRRRIGQLASNLVGNALTHGAAETPVRVSASTAGGQFELVVANGGEMIPGPVLDSIFKPFSRGSHKNGAEGLGLGLYISQVIAEAHGGTLTVTSTPDETCFTFRMPLQR